MSGLWEILNRSILVVDKHAGPTSHQVSGWLREILNLKKVGHLGTLDPMVTGLLPVLLGEAVKATPLLAAIDKEYVGVMHLHQDVSQEKIQEAVKNFVGKITQRPPKKSAVARYEREREIFSFDIIEIEDRDVLFKTKTEAGTYIRKLCHDIGQKIGSGAHMSELRRTQAGVFNEGQSSSLMEIKDSFEFAKSGDDKKFRSMLIPIEDAIPEPKKIYARDSALEFVMKGAPLYVGGVVKADENLLAGETVAMVSEKNKIVAVGIVKMSGEEMSKRKKGTAVRTDRIISVNPK
jgi:H/ACA ribonucleoprotein complex subunit 4